MIKKNVTQISFDVVASTYQPSAQTFSDKIYKYFENTYKLKQNEIVIDLGCGTGYFTFPLREIYSNVIGLDSSAEMLKVAKLNDKTNSITWINEDVQNFDFRQNIYSLVFSFESFHLFNDQNIIINKIFHGLKKGGYLCIGWCELHWENTLKDLIIETFLNHKIILDKWQYQVKDDMPTLIRESKLGYSTAIIDKVIVDEDSKIYDIAFYLARISKTLHLDHKKRLQLESDLYENFRRHSKKDYLSGSSIYSFVRTMKV